ncbi:MAG: hypothetical protein N2578_09000, partial [Bdellovibrionaceae bacterium]|nr:hypothetical protein [Pseudobdellovibrionaceae bacterium]
YRISANGQVLDGADTLQAIIDIGRRLEAAGICRLASQEVCGLAPAGVINNSYFSMIVTKMNRPFAGADQLADALGAISLLEQAQVCRPQPASCDLLGSGVVANRYFRHRIAIGGQVVLGADDMNVVLSQFGDLRRAQICL